MAGDSIGALPPAIFIIYIRKPRPLPVVVVVMMMVMMMVGLRWGGHCQNRKSGASEDHFL